MGLADDEGMNTLTSTHRFLAIPADVLGELQVRDDAGRAPQLEIDEEGGSPLRCCLTGAQPGEQVALVSYAPLRRWAREFGAQPGPYEELGPVFIHPGACPGPDGEGAPARFLTAHRMLRAYTAAGTIHGGRLVELDGPDAAAELGQAVTEMFAEPEVALIHLRAVEYGCFLADIRRRDA
jgi:hypothetical protein